MTDREQKLVDLVFECVLTATDPRYAPGLSAYSTELRARWVAEQLRACGFPTVPVGASWGVLVPEKSP